jgi:hypothetical protein
MPSIKANIFLKSETTSFNSYFTGFWSNCLRIRTVFGTKKMEGSVIYI